MPPWSLYVRCWGQSGKHVLRLSFSAFDHPYATSTEGQAKARLALPEGGFAVRVSF
jgi:hypothetical protein